MSNLQLDGTKLQYHLDALAKWKRGETVYPILVEISPTNACNHACTFCAYDYIDRDNKFLNTERLISILDELKPLGSKSLFYSGEGEPMLHKDMVQIVKHAAGLGYDQGLNTNASALVGDTMHAIVDHMTFIRTSVNGATAQEYADVHKVQPKHFDKILSNVEEAVKYKDREGLDTTFGIQMVYLGQNIDDIVKLGERARDMGVDYFSVKQFNEHPRNPFKDDFEALTEEQMAPIRALAGDGFQTTVRAGLRVGTEKRNYKQCLSLPFFAEIVANGEVYACGPHLGEADFCYGNIHDMDFKELWMPENRAKVTDHIDNVEDLDCVCMPNCRLDALNRFLWDLDNPPEHVNFI